MERSLRARSIEPEPDECCLLFTFSDGDDAMTKYQPYERGKCLHCQTVVRFIEPESKPFWMKAFGSDEHLKITTCQCPNCGRIISTIEKLEPTPNMGLVSRGEYVVWPMSSGRDQAPPEVPSQIAQDFNEAAVVLPVSPKASAALSRRCLQSVLKDAGKTKSKDLAKQIDEVLESLPLYIAENLDAVRNIGNFAAHEQKSKSSGSILDVEPGEGEWNLDVLESLFDFYYVRPEVERKKREYLDQKLEEAGKPSLKKPSENAKVDQEGSG